MDTTNTKKIVSSAGFSLVELMIVVAILGILASIALPNFSKQSNRAKQAEAKVALNGIFTAENTYFIQSGSYTGCLSNIGYKGDGLTIYKVGFKTVTAKSVVGLSDCAPGLNVSFFGTSTENLPTDTEATQSTFKAGAVGKLSSRDAWTIDQDRNLVNTLNGI